MWCLLSLSPRARTSWTFQTIAIFLPQPTWTVGACVCGARSACWVGWLASLVCWCVALFAFGVRGSLRGYVSTALVVVCRLELGGRRVIARQAPRLCCVRSRCERVCVFQLRACLRSRYARCARSHGSWWSRCIARGCLHLTLLMCGFVMLGSLSAANPARSRVESHRRTSPR